MTEFAEYLEAEVLAQYFENQSVYVALWASNPANNPDETNEVSGDGYSRDESSLDLRPKA
jgi:hypothetical protein